MFCDINPTCYKIALQKEICKRHIRNFLAHVNYAKTHQTAPLPQIVSSCSSHLIKHGKDIDPVLQENKAVNIRLANQRLNGILIRPGETFSFWQIVGKTTKRKGYRDGRILMRNHLLPGIGGGLCNLANTIHRVVLLSPMTVTEFHSHSDALAPDEGARVHSAPARRCFTITGITVFETIRIRHFSCFCGAMPITSTRSCAGSTPCPTAIALLRRGITSKKKATITIAYQKFTRKLWTPSQVMSQRGNWYWTTTRRLCMTQA